jgi:hypothetical protein
MRNATSKSLLAGILFALGTTASQAEICGSPTIVTLYAGKTIESGIVAVWNDENQTLYVQYNTTSPWLMTETHLATGLSLADIPQTRGGNPKIGRFPYQRSYEPPVMEDIYMIEGYSFGQEPVIAAHAVVVQLDEEGGEISANETGWGDGDGFPGRSWAMYFSHTMQECEAEPPSPIMPGDFRTQTQGGWGTACSGNNPGCYRDAHFATTFPYGMMIGDAEYGAGIEFTSSAAVQAFLPQGGTPAVLQSITTNPLSTEAGVLAGQVTALTLSVNFDLADPDFGASTTNLADLRAVSGDCQGMSVGDILDEATLVLVGSGSFTPSQINSCVSAINENFVDGTMVGNYLMLP